MGHWEQIGVENRSIRAERAAWSPRRRLAWSLTQAGIVALPWLAVAALILWAAKRP